MKYQYIIVCAYLDTCTVPRLVTHSSKRREYNVRVYSISTYSALLNVNIQSLCSLGPLGMQQGCKRGVVSVQWCIGPVNRMRCKKKVWSMRNIDVMPKAREVVECMKCKVMFSSVKFMR